MWPPLSSVKRDILILYRRGISFNMTTARAHKPGSIKKLFPQFGVEEFNWPAQSSDLNLIQHLLDELGVLNTSQASPGLIDQLKWLISLMLL